MIKAKIKNKEYQIKNSWSDLTYQNYIDVCKMSDIEALSFLSGIEPNILNSLDELSLERLLFCIDFLKETPKEIVECKNIKKETFGQKIILQNQLRNSEPQLSPAVALAVYEYDYNEFNKSLLEVLKMPFNEVYCKGLDYLKQFNDIVEMESEHLKSEPTTEQRQAGIDMFDEFGIMNTVDSLAGGDVLNYEKILNIDYNTIFIKLKMLKFAGIYNKNYSKIQNRK